MNCVARLLVLVGFFAGVCAVAQHVVPGVGCPSDGQLGPLPPPQVKPHRVEVSATDAAKLAYYSAKNGPSVLGPQGWHCLGTYGSNGSSLYLSPEGITTSDFFQSKPKWKGIPGFGIQLSSISGGTLGRFRVAAVIARIFPKYRTFVDNVLSEGIETAADFPSGPYPADKLTYPSDHLAEFLTPANAEGLGTDSWLRRNDFPIHGFMALSGADTDLIQLFVRLPADFASLVPVIIQDTERKSTSGQPPPHRN